MPTKKAVKTAKIQSKADQNKKNVSKSASKSVSQSQPKHKVRKNLPIPKLNSTNKKIDSKSIKKDEKSVDKSKNKDLKAVSSSLGKDNKKTTAILNNVPVVVQDNKKDDKSLKKSQSKQKIVKVITKGGAAVDSLVQNSSQYRVFADSNRVYSATLNQANLMENNNKFYIIQILQHQKKNQIFFWNRWGRVGVPGQFVLKGPFDKNKAINEFNAKIHDKTVKGDYKQIQIKYDDKEQQKKEQKKQQKKGPKKQVKSQMDENLQNLINLIFDTTIMNNTMKEIGYDSKKMPLGKLGDNTIKQAYTILNKILEAIKKKNNPLQYELSSQFYTLIPHDFGFQKMSNFVLNNEQKVKQKLKMLEAISDMKITTKLLEQKSNDQIAVLDQNYKKLGCQIKSLKKQSSDYKLLVEYFNNTKGSFSNVKIGDIFQIVRPEQQTRYAQKIGNHMLLWHGSRLSNFVGILSQGLRIAPPEAPVSGYLFGKGIYLADMAQKSIHYCRSYGSDTALILLIQGAIGDPNILLQSSYQAKQLMEKNNKNSTKCHGSKAPPEQSYIKLKHMIVPKGAPKSTGSGSYMGHNQFIVYNINQARIRYILRMDMKGY